MAEELTPEQEEMAMQFAAARSRARMRQESPAEKIQKAERVAKVAAGGAKVAGKGIQAAGTAAEVGGQAAQAGGKALQAGGEAARTTGMGIARAGAAASSTGLGALAGVPMMAAGGLMVGGGAAAEGAGIAAQAGGKAAAAGGRVAKKGGGQLSSLGSTLQQTEKAIGGLGGELGKIGGGGAGGDVMGRVQKFAAGRMQSALAKAVTPEKADVAMAQAKRALDTAKKFKDLLRGGAAGAIIGIFYTLLSYIKDYILGNIIGNGDPSGIVSNKKTKFFGYQVTPLSFPEVLILFAVIGNLFINWFIQWGLPLTIIGFIIFAIAAPGDAVAMISDLVKLLGPDIVDPIKSAFGG
ncbi:MAG: hypothetical protein PHW53_02460 [Patescibacteria group bacterium]|nr:hypothetical protein [Patescibacteria group bacterium]